MRDHAIVSPHFWTGETGRLLRHDPDAQRIAFYLMTCPHANMIGLYYLPLPFICHEVGITDKGAMKGLARLFEVSFCAYDYPSETVFVTQMARYQVGETLDRKDNRHKGVLKLLSQMKNCIFYNDFLSRYNDDFHLNLEPNTSPFEAPSKPLRSKDKDKDKDKEKDKDKDKEQTYKPMGKRADKQAIIIAEDHGLLVWPSPEAFVALYNTNTPEDHPKVTVISAERRKHIQGYVAQFPDQAFWEQVYAELCHSPFLLGQKSSQGRRPIKRGLDWLLQKGQEDGIENCVKTYEGKYRDAADVPHNRPYMG
jgi:hypothetical protein